MAGLGPGSFDDIRNALGGGGGGGSGQPPTLGMGDGGGFDPGGYIIRDQAAFDALVNSILDDVRNCPMGDLLQGEMRLLEKAHDEKFRSGGAGYFTSAGGWAPNAQSTVRKKGHARPLFGVPSQGFRLHKSLTQPQSEFGIRYAVENWPDRAQVIFGTDAPYHKYNEYGTSRIPARPHLGVSAEFIDGTTQRVVDHVFKAIQES